MYVIVENKLIMTCMNTACDQHTVSILQRANDLAPFQFRDKISVLFYK